MSLLNAVQSARGETSGSGSSSGGSSLLKAVRTSRGEITAPKPTRTSKPVQFNLDKPLLKRTAPREVPKPLTKVGQLARLAPTPATPLPGQNYEPDIDFSFSRMQDDLLKRQSSDPSRAEEFGQRSVRLMEAQKEKNPVKKFGGWLSEASKRVGSDLYTSIIGLGKSLIDSFGTQLFEQDQELKRSRAERITDPAKRKKYEELFLPKEGEDDTVYTRLISQKLEDEIVKNAVTNPGDIDKLFSALGSMSAFAAVSLPTGGSPLLGVLLESAGESGDAYERLRSEGKSVREAGDEASVVYATNLIVNSAFNVLDPTGQNKALRERLNAMMVGVSKEGLQEGLQQLIQNNADGKTGMALLDGVGEAMAIGGIVGGVAGFSLPGETGPQATVDEKTAEKKEEVKKEVKKDEPTKVGDVVTMKAEDLVTHEEAVDEQQVERFREEIKSGGKPAIIVQKEGDKFAVEDGKHKLEAYKREGITEVPTVEKVVEKAPVKEVKPKEVKDAQGGLGDIKPNPDHIPPKSIGIRQHSNKKNIQQSVLFDKRTGKDIAPIGTRAEELDLLKNGYQPASYKDGFPYDPKSLSPSQGVKAKATKKVVVKPKKKVKIISAPREQLPVGEGKKKASRLEARVKKALGDVTKEQIDELGLTTYNEMNQDENIAKAVKYVLENPEDAIKVLTGEIPAPKGILKNSVMIAMQQQDIKDVDIATKLASLSSTRAGQEIGILRKVDPNRPVNILSDIIRFRTKAIQKRHAGKTTNKIVKSKVKKGQSMIKAPKVADWGKIIREVGC